jgi:hypothetical protein
VDGAAGELGAFPVSRSAQGVPVPFAGAGGASSLPAALGALPAAMAATAAAALPPGCGTSIFGPRRYDRTTAPPNEYTDVVTVPAGVPSPYTLYVQNGEPDGSHRVSSAVVKVNGAQVVGPSDLNQNVAGLQRQVNLAPTTTLFVRVASAPGSYLIINL